jgi:alpha-beta hydrolase superfamily lysophospholipase
MKISTPLNRERTTTMSILSTLKLPSTGVELLFRGQESEPADPPSKTMQVVLPSGRKVHLRQWQPQEGQEAPGGKGTEGSPLVLMVHGLGGCTEWMGPMAAKLLEKQSLVFGLDIPRIGRNPSQIGDFEDRRDLLREVAETVQYLSQEHDRPVYALGLSLGGLLVTHVAANPPKELAGIMVVSPAYKAASATFKPMIYVKALFKRALEKLHLLTPDPIAIPYAEDQTSVTRNPEKRKLIHETPDRVNFLTPRACVELIKLTLMDTPKTSTKIQLPVVMFVAQKDVICDPQAMVNAYAKFPSQDKQLYLLNEAMHDIVLDPEMPAMADTMNAWLATRASRLSPPTACEGSPSLVESSAQPEA